MARSRTAEQPPHQPPRFCPRCRQPSRQEGQLCADCGERLCNQGYCPVCERFWRQEPGTLCPKHDLPLDTAPLEEAHPAIHGDDHWVTVASYNLPIQAGAPRLRLEAEGIPTFLDGERMGNHAFHHPAAGGVRLQVPARLAGEARILLNQTWSSADPGDDLDDAYEELAPEPGAHRREVMRSLVVLFLLLPVIRGIAVVIDTLFR